MMGFFDLKKLNTKIENEPDNPDCYFERAEYYKYKGKDLEAVSDFRKVLELNPASRTGYMNLAMLLIKISKTGEALETYDQLIMHFPENSEAYSYRAQVYYLNDEFEKAAADCKIALQLALKPGSKTEKEDLAVNYLMLAKSLIKTKDFQKALSVFGDALKACPDYSILYSERSKLLNLLGEKDKADQDLKEADKLESL